MNLLHIDSSPQGFDSVSRGLSARVIDRMRLAEPTLRVVRRDLGSEPVPHLTQSAVAAIRRGEAATQEERVALALSDSLIDELAGASLIVIGSPMYNFGMASQLKAWFDYVVRAGKTFTYGETGPRGLLADKRVFVVESRGGVYSAGPMAFFDHQEPHTRNLLAFIGLTDIHFIRAEGLAMGRDNREQAIADASRTIDSLVSPNLELAA